MQIAEKQSTAPVARKIETLAERLAVVGLVSSALYVLVLSWRRWPDPVIDAGHQLYTAWRLSEGALLYRDVGCLYGPLSSYVNALLFRLFGPGMMVLVWANLIVYAAILFLAYRLFRAAYGALGAITACGVFVWIFSFNQLVAVGNYTYALPYAHESTHGVLLTLALLWIAERWIQKASRWLALFQGLACGLALVLKPEFMLASALVTTAAMGIRWRRRISILPSELLALGLGTLTPMALFVGWFWWQLPFAAAFRSANQAWWAVVVEGVDAHVWQSFSGTDAPTDNLVALLLATAFLAGGVASMWFGARRLARGTTAAAMLVVLPCALVLAQVNWMRAAFCVPLTLLVLLAVRSAGLFLPSRFSWPGRDDLGLLLALAALALLVRMFLNPRVYHFGFYQAALATMVVVAECTALLRRAVAGSRLAAGVTWSCAALVLCAACVDVHLRSRQVYALRTQAVGQGRDRFLAFSPRQDALGLMVESVLEELRRLPAPGRLLVVPEGLMVNYLARRISPVAEWIFIDLTLANGKEGRLVERLAANPPEYVVLLSRDLREHGISRFGDPGQPGQGLLKYLSGHYERHSQFGGDPFDVSTRGAVLLKLVGAKRAAPPE
jgi:hypothetical protein